MPLPDTPAAWREQLELPGDPFVMQGTGQNEAGWVKFTVVPDAAGSHRVYFQDGHSYRFHYDFAVEHLAEFAGMTAEQFDSATL